MLQKGKRSILIHFDIPSNEILNNCIHCGLCLSNCPTYSITCSEKSSPRGRIRLIKAVADGTLEITRDFISEMNFCLGCRACETACPAGIKYGLLAEMAKIHIYQSIHRYDLKNLIGRSVVNWIFSKHARLKQLARIVRVFQNSFIFRKNILRKIFRFYSKTILITLELVPKISESFSTDVLKERVHSVTKPKYRVILLTGCIMDVAFADVNDDTVQLLSKQGCEVIIPKEQICCGALQFHNGDLAGARKSSLHNINLFMRYDSDYIITNSAGCGAFMKKYPEIFKEDEQLFENAKSLSNRVKDITEFLADIDLPQVELRKDNRFFAKKITYHDACHLIHAQGISDQPRMLIRKIKGIEFTELPEASWCCGSAGVYNITHYKDSMQILERKINCIKQVNPDVIISGNPGCLIQLRYGLQKVGLNIELLHTVTFLRKVYMD
jgi:glycolate oxidase iron-sulfur subunit